MPDLRGSYHKDPTTEEKTKVRQFILYLNVVFGFIIVQCLLKQN